MNRSYLLVMILFFLGFSCYGMFHHRDSSYFNHVQLVHQFKCSLPQPRAVPIDEILSVGPSPDEIFYPPSTVLARCAGAGCCPDDKHICGAVETKNISLIFLVKHRIDQQRDRHHEIIHAVEHVKCACMHPDKELLY